MQLRYTLPKSCQSQASGMGVCSSVCLDPDAGDRRPGGLAGRRGLAHEALARADGATQTRRARGEVALQGSR